MPYIISIVVFVLFAVALGFSEGVALAAVSLVFLLHFQSRERMDVLSVELSELKKRLLNAERQSLNSDRVEPVQENTTAPPASVEQNQAPPAKDKDHVLSDVPLDIPLTAAATIQTEPVATKTEDSPWGNSVHPVDVNSDNDDVFTRYLSKAYSAVYDVIYKYFTDGNLFVRIGILILFFGVSFLLKYAAEHSQIAIEYRISAVALGGLAMLYFGWRIRKNKGVYALLLQGCGIGILYLAFFSSFKVYALISPTMTFILLAALGVSAVVLAVLQDSKALAAFGITGGFIAPILASTGSGNYIALFSYYILLNIGVISTAWYKSWRIVNLIGFFFTFSVFTSWVVSSYKTAYLVSADAFLIAFFLMYSITSVLYALRQPLNLKGYVDGTLVFGVPLIAWGLQMAMMDSVEYGVAVSAFLFGFYHIALAKFLWNKHSEDLKLFVLSLLSIGVVFITLAIPYSLDGHWTSATWALEGAGILWVSLKQNKKFAQYFSVLLQFVAAGVFLVHLPSSHKVLTPLINPYFIGGMIISVSSFFSAWNLYKYAQNGERSLLLRLNPVIYLWALVWWFGIGLSEIQRHTDLDRSFSLIALLYFVATSLAAWYWSRRLNWRHAEYAAIACLAGFVLFGLAPLLEFQPPFAVLDGIVWFMTLVYSLWLLKRYEVLDSYHSIVKRVYVLLTLFYVALVTTEFAWFVEVNTYNSGDAWLLASWMVVPCMAVYALLRAKYWPLVSFDYYVARTSSLMLVVVMLFWSLAVNLFSDGDASPINYYPVFNPIDIMHIVILVLSISFYLKYGSKAVSEIIRDVFKPVYITSLAAIVFVWINAILLRTISHYFDVHYDMGHLWHSSLVQVSLSILWTIMGMLAMIFATRKLQRKIWVAGAVLVGVVLVKLIFIDLAASGTVERIVSFMVVGLLLVGMGYFSPIPITSSSVSKKQPVSE